MRSLISTTWNCTLIIITFVLIIQQYQSVTEAAYQPQQRGPNPYLTRYQNEPQQQQQPNQQQQSQQQLLLQQQQQQQQQLQLQQQQQQLQQQREREPLNRNFRTNNNNNNNDVNKNIEYDNDDENEDDEIETSYKHNRNRKISDGGANRIETYQQTKTARGNRPNVNAGRLNPKSKCPIWVPIDALDKYPLASRSSPQIDQKLQTQLVDVCCDGYKGEEWRGNTICRPVCEGCQNGQCIAPGECQCYDEYVMNDNNECVFACPMGCLNGRCYLDGSCQCNIGYKLDESRKFCRPICSEGCGNNPRHNCTEPEVCSCSKGYTLKDSGCEPVCDPDCGDGSRCRDTNDCSCKEGFVLKEGTCQSDCYQECKNGYCIGRNRCICKPGFTYHERSTHCIPV